MTDTHLPEPLDGDWQQDLIRVHAEAARERLPERGRGPLPERRREEARAAPVRASRRPRGLLLGLVTLAIILAVLFGPGIVGSVLDRIDYRSSVHGDRSSIASGVRPQTARSALLVYRDREGNTVRALANEAELSAFVRAEFRRLQAGREEARARAQAVLEAGAAPVFATMRERVAEFGDWYFAWPTSYRLTGKAMYSAAAHTLRPSVMRLDDAVAYDLERYVEKRYRDIVQRPEVSDAQLGDAFTRAMTQARAEFDSALAGFDDRFQTFVAERTTYLGETSGAGDAVVRLDWDNQAKKLTLTGVERGAVEATRGVALAVAGAVVGRQVGAAAGRAVAGRMAARLAGPYVARGLGTATATAVGASGGVVGMVVGGATGLGIDYLINEGMAYAQRDELEARLHESLAMQEQLWQSQMRAAIDEAVDIWFDDLTELLAHYDA
ncbi:MAG: hypothetical protein R3286_16585 [Gammaproteobacteria bacterium]|nr:hypothetical protein [Gammaproteobacteria bacterium]